MELYARGVLPYMAYTAMCHWTGYGFDFSVLHRVYSFEQICQRGIARTICQMNYVLQEYKSNDNNMNLLYCNCQ